MISKKIMGWCLYVCLMALDLLLVELGRGTLVLGYVVPRGLLEGSLRRMQFSSLGFLECGGGGVYVLSFVSHPGSL